MSCATEPTPKAVYGSVAKSSRLATGSSVELGLLERLVEMFCEENDARIEWFRAGSGAALMRRGAPTLATRFLEYLDIRTESVTRNRLYGCDLKDGPVKDRHA